jgi:FkbM family methyltransferase
LVVGLSALRACDRSRAIHQYLKPGDTFWDIGAHVGWFSVFASHIVGRTGRVLAIEPAPEAYAKLKANLHLRPIAIAINCGVGNTEGMREFSAQGSATSGSFVPAVTAINAHYNDAAVTSRSVEMRRVDDLPGQPDLIKIDIEGFELEALRGAERILRQTRPTLIVEIHPPQLELCGGSAEAIYDLLRIQNYAVQEIDRTDHTPRSLFTICATPLA